MMWLIRADSLRMARNFPNDSIQGFPSALFARSLIGNGFGYEFAQGDAAFGRLGFRSPE
jgi:hypothetical protein